MVLNNTYCGPSATTGSQPQIKNTGFDLWLDKSSDAKPWDMEDQLYTVQAHAVQGLSAL